MGWSRPEYARVAALIAERTGLTFPATRQPDMERALRDVLEDPTSRPRLDELLGRDTAARDELIASLTVGESYFFRDPAQFRLLRDELLPAAASARGTAPIRMWSAGCAAGEEAYSLAILGEQLGLHARTSVLGTDLSRVRLAAARSASYSKWALRGLDARTIEQYFTTSGSRYVLRPTFRERVEFRYLNLAEDRYPSLTAGIWGFDVILCRNVLIYFDRDTIARVAARLIASLSEDGWLLLGAADPAISEFVDCDVVLTSAGLAYRRNAKIGGSVAAAMPRGAMRDNGGTVAREAAADTTDANAGTATAPSDGDAPFARADAREEREIAAADAVEAVAAPPAGADGVTSAVRDAYVARAYALAAARAETELRVHDTVSLRVLHVRSLANLGELEAAGHASAAALERHRDSAELLYLHALLLVAAGKWADAAAAARRALYLDRRLVVAHVTLALALERIGDITGARRALRNAVSLLAAEPADAVVPASDGESVRRLRTNVEAQLRMLEGVA